MNAETSAPESALPAPEAELPGPRPHPTVHGRPTRAQLTLSPGDTRWEVAVVLYGVPADEWPTTRLPGPEAPPLKVRGEALTFLGYAQTGPGPHYWEWAECQDGDHDPVRLMAHTEVRPAGIQDPAAGGPGS
ncbi:DUF6303 family protein [Streptomyces albulus]|uniref:DUF6303 family protein n=1 Tax=Streptomyces noursei TaxID=1971 RepID=UPI0022C2A1A9|nr:DUF6303 family protein [Streptomyces noursei]